MENKGYMFQQDNNEKATISYGANSFINKPVESELPISKIRVVTAKYKMYMILLLIGICIIGYNIPDLRSAYNSSSSNLTSYKENLNDLKNQIQVAENDENLLVSILNNKMLLQQCLNDSQNCDNLPEEWKKDLSVPVSYLQVHSLYNDKMSVDEKKVLRNLNEYLIKRDIDGNSKTRVGEILKIVIGDNEETKINEKFISVPVDVTIEFNSISDLTGFLYNVEKKLIDNEDDRILYKIKSVSYDVVSNDEPQTTELSMIAYYYYDERFDGINETEYYAENTTQSEDNEIDESNSQASNNSESSLNQIIES